jgi:hypothetical protein
MLAGFLASFSSKESKESTPQLFSVDIRYITSVYTRWADSSVTFPHPVKIFLTQASSRPIVGTLLAPIGYFLPVRPLLAPAQQSRSGHHPGTSQKPLVSPLPLIARVAQGGVLGVSNSK